MVITSCEVHIFSALPKQKTICGKIILFDSVVKYAIVLVLAISRFFGGWLEEDPLKE